MPLLKRRPFALLGPPEDLKPGELVYQVRFTKEIFRDYREYLKRISEYRQRFWTCKVTGKGNLTYEEALVSEKHATEKVQQFPEELMKPVLQILQFSMLTLTDLVSTIRSRVQEQLVVGLELSGKKDDCLHPCKITKVVQGVDKTQYEVAWMDNDKKITGKAVMYEDDLVRKKLPFTRNVLKSFIRESTRQSFPWVLHDKLAQKHGIPTVPPEDMKSNFIIHDGRFVQNKRRKTEANGRNNCKRKKMENGDVAEKEDEKTEEEPIKYPIDDLSLPSIADDSVLTNRPSPSRDFNVPMDCVGDLLMVWDFCSSFSRLLKLWPFSLEDFENAICHKDSNSVLIVETHAAILRLLIKDSGSGKYFIAIKEKKRTSKITLITWTDYLSDFLEMIDIPELSTCIATIKRGHYGLLDIHAKLGILRELVAQAVVTDLLREKLDDNIEQRQALGATRRGEAVEEARKKREEKNVQSLDSVGVNLSENSNHKQNGGTVEKRNRTRVPSGKKQASGNSEKKHAKEVEEKGGKEEKGSKEQRKENYEREIAKLVIRSSPLGKDRHYNRYWFFRRDGRIFVESSDFKQWGYYSTKEELDALMGSLNCKGVREWALHLQLAKYYHAISLELQKRSKEATQRAEMEKPDLRRSTRVRAPPRNNPALAFRNYVNKWKKSSGGLFQGK